MGAAHTQVHLHLYRGEQRTGFFRKSQLVLSLPFHRWVHSNFHPPLRCPLSNILEMFVVWHLLVCISLLHISARCDSTFFPPIFGQNCGVHVPLPRFGTVLTPPAVSGAPRTSFPACLRFSGTLFSHKLCHLCTFPDTLPWQLCRRAAHLNGKGIHVLCL